MDQVVEGEKLLDVELIEDIKSRMILHWNYRNLKEIPEELLQGGEHIKEIYLKRNCITTLPKDFGIKLKNLTNLYLIGNQLSILSPEIEQLVNLKVLDLSQNLLQSIPSNIGNLSALEQLLLTNNFLTYLLPKELGKLTRLKFLELSGNKLQILQHEIINGLQSLEELAIDGNPITHFPRNIVLLPKLRYVSACKCKLLYLPSMPFWLLVNGTRPTGNYTPNTAISYNSQDFKPLTEFTLLFDSNLELNYLPYWVQNLNLEGEVFGCGFNVSTKSNKSQFNPKLFPTDDNLGLKLDLNLKDVGFLSNNKDHILYFDDDLQRIHNETALNEDEPSSLLEQSLGVVYKEELYKHQSIGNKPTAVQEPLFKYSLRCPHSDHFVSSASDSLYDYTTTMSRQSAIEIDTKEDISRPQKQSLESKSLLTKQLPLLPQNLNEILSKDVVSRCFYCLKPIFTETWLMVFGIPLSDLKQRMDNLQQQPQQAPHQQRLLELQNANDDEKRLQISCINLCSKACKSKLRELGSTSKRNSFVYRDYLKYEITKFKGTE